MRQNVFEPAQQAVMPGIGGSAVKDVETGGRFAVGNLRRQAHQGRRQHAEGRLILLAND